MRRWVMLMLAVLSVGLVASCSSSTASEGAVATVNRVDVTKFNEVVQTAGTKVVDVRTPAEFAAGHLADAVNIDVEAPTFAQQIGTLDKAATYAVYCRAGNRSRTASQQMADAGFTTIYDLDGGINAWIAAGFPIVQ